MAATQVWTTHDAIVIIGPLFMVNSLTTCSIDQILYYTIPLEFSRHKAEENHNIGQFQCKLKFKVCEMCKLHSNSFDVMQLFPRFCCCTDLAVAPLSLALPGILAL